MTTAERFGLTFNDQIRSYSDRKKFFDSYKEAIYALVCRFKTYPIPKSVREASFAAQWSKSARDWIMREDFDSSEEENEPSTSKGSAPKENVEESSDENTEQVVE